MKTVRVTTRLEIDHHIPVSDTEGLTMGEVINNNLRQLENDFGPGRIDRVTISGLKGLNVVDPIKRKPR